MSGQTLNLRAFNALFPDEDAARGVVGAWRQIRVKHLRRYASDAAFRWNRKPDAILGRMEAIVRDEEGRLLSYAFLTREHRSA